ncbi:2-C-methyl-D-erythritol 2,4-cyclodiphosphate synthase [Bifidobacterium sp. DSM 109958]|uniref:2-C-methyl-D-erythritol 2,4-cyclodiphosphate synthase n=1 Tax=Bifidobacterium moraviense TaxID=2675323 RepID=A0A7Y0F025_9BIFI|nr:2-C-methyl-D-erythritol 2,4-cyclodiphosphate synthase [Bifidobacterium sp. DSM 109958]NMM99546.1 2-C-methyl-D-erythritol 2,4-cyclodiphosphate synthase [Bifidobacterium sp. DSM 109958]
MGGGTSIGQGFDAHRFAPDGAGRELWMAGLRWDGQGEGVEGDSDGDVAVHALIDALLSAAGLGDIGTLFGVGEDSLGAGMHGLPMLERTADHLRAHGFVPASASVCVIGNRPRIGARRRQAEEALSAAAGCRVSLTATTTDRMGFTGRGEGVAAIASALVGNPSGIPGAAL